MKKKIFMSAAKKARIALTVMAVCSFTLAGAQSTFAEDPSTTTEHPVKIDAEKNIICGEGATASNDPDSDWPGSGIIVIGNGTVAKGMSLLPLVMELMLQATILPHLAPKLKQPEAVWR